MEPTRRSPRLAEAPPLPERLGRYEVLLPIASGGMATVFLGRTTGIAGFEREVALKLTHVHLRDDPAFVAALMDEARLAGRIRHPNVVSVLDVGEDAAGVFVVMDYVEGDSLSNLARTLRKLGREVPLGILMRIADDVLSGLHAAHELTDPEGTPVHLVHRDVTPHNILVGVDGASRLTDFGIAKARTRLVQTSSGLIKGKLAYMSPEQARGEEIDRRCDVWAAGVVCWELLTGHRLFDGPNEAAILLKVVKDEPPRPSRVNPRVPKPVDQVVARALARNATDRWPSAEAFAVALREASQVAGVAIADPRDGAAFVAPLVSDKLQERRSKAREVLELRRRMGALVELPSSPSHSTPGAPLPSEPDAATVTTLSAQHVISLDNSVGRGSAAGVETLTDAADVASASAAPRASAAPGRGGVWLAFGLVVVLGIAVAVATFIRSPEASQRLMVVAPAARADARRAVASATASPAPERDAVPSAVPVAASAIASPAASSVKPATATPPLAGARDPRPRPPKPNCNPPYIIDQRGIQVFKPECM